MTDICSCGFKFTKVGGFRNCNGFIGKNGQGGIICPDCNARYLVND